MALPFPLIAAGERHVDSSVAAIVIATVPLLIALLALRFDHTERPTRTRMVGMLIGLGGVVALVGIDLSARADEILGAAAVMLAALGYAAGPMIIKRHLVGFDPRATMAASLAVAAVLLTPAALITFPKSVPPGDALDVDAVLGVVCTATAFVILMVLVTEVGAGRASIITYVNPVVAVTLGVIVLGESPGAGAIAGLLLILAGSWLGDGRTPPAGGQRGGHALTAAPQASRGRGADRSARRSVVDDRERSYEAPARPAVAASGVGNRWRRGERGGEQQRGEQGEPLGRGGRQVLGGDLGERLILEPDQLGSSSGRRSACGASRLDRGRELRHRDDLLRVGADDHPAERDHGVQIDALEDQVAASIRGTRRGPKVERVLTRQKTLELEAANAAQLIG